MPQRLRSQRLNGLFPLSYMGVIPTSPSNFIMDQRPPTQNDAANFYIGDLWLDTFSNLPAKPQAKNLWVLVSLVQGLATWINFASGDIVTLTGNNSSVHVPPDINGNINIIGDGTTVTVVGNAGTNTLTITAINSSSNIQTITGNNAVAVSPLAGNINVVGDTTTINIVGNAGTHTLTASTSGAVATKYQGNSVGTATPVAGILNILGDTTTATTTASGNTVTITALTPGNVATTYVEDSLSATPSGNVLNIIGGTGITTSGAGNTVTITNTGSGSNPAATNSFFAYLSTSTGAVTGDGTDYHVIYDTVVFNNGGNYNNGTGVYTAPATGVYVFNVGTNFGSLAPGMDGGSQFITTNATTTIMRLNDITSANSGAPFFSVTTSGTITIALNIGETIYLGVEVKDGAKVVTVRGGTGVSLVTWFSGYRLF